MVTEIFDRNYFEMGQFSIKSATKFHTFSFTPVATRNGLQVWRTRLRTRDRRGIGVAASDIRKIPKIYRKFCVKYFLKTF